MACLVRAAGADPDIGPIMSFRSLARCEKNVKPEQFLHPGIGSAMKIVKCFHRIYLRPEDLESTRRFYMALQGVDRPHHSFHYEAFRLDIVAIGSILLIAGAREDTARFEATRMTCLVDDLDALRAYFVDQGVEIIDDLKTVPSGRNLRARNPDGTVVEYVQHSEEFKRRITDHAYD
jgi:hypothetical protein